MSDQAWRGVAAEDDPDVDTQVTLLLRGRSRRLLGSLLRPYRRTLWVTGLVVLAQNLATMAAPLLVGVGIDHALPALREGDWRPLLLTFAGLLGAALLAAVLRRHFLRVLGRVGQQVALDGLGVVEMECYGQAGGLHVPLAQGSFQHVERARAPLAQHQRVG